MTAAERDPAAIAGYHAHTGGSEIIGHRHPWDGPGIDQRPHGGEALRHSLGGGLVVIRVRVGKQPGQCRIASQIALSNRP